MKINTNLLNLVRQILEAEEARSQLVDVSSKEGRRLSDQIADLKDEAIVDMIKTAPLPHTYTTRSAMNKLNETIQMFAIFGKEDRV